MCKPNRPSIRKREREEGREGTERKKERGEDEEAKRVDRRD